MTKSEWGIEAASIWAGLKDDEEDIVRWGREKKEHHRQKEQSEARGQDVKVQIELRENELVGLGWVC